MRSRTRVIAARVTPAATRAIGLDSGLLGSVRSRWVRRLELRLHLRAVRLGWGSVG